MDRCGKTCLDYCMHYDCPEAMVAILNTQPGLINHRNSSGMTPIAQACGQSASKGCVRILLSSKLCDLNGTDLKLLTPLHQCAMYNRVSSARRLLEKGAAIQPIDSTGFTPMDHAIERGFSEMANVLSEIAERRMSKRARAMSAISWTSATSSADPNRRLSTQSSHSTNRRASAMSTDSGGVPAQPFRRSSVERRGSSERCSPDGAEPVVASAVGVERRNSIGRASAANQDILMLSMIRESPEKGLSTPTLSAPSSPMFPEPSAPQHRRAPSRNNRVLPMDAQNSAKKSSKGCVVS